MNGKRTIQIALTPEQNEHVKKAAGKEIVSLKLEALEQRFSPGTMLN